MAKVLVVEDDEDIRDLIVSRIERDGHSVLAVGDAETALRVVGERGAPDVAVLDISLPKMDGLELCVRLRDDVGQPNLPVVFLTARVNYDDVEAGRSLGATYLTKPVVANALLKAIHRATNDPRGW
jgi:CheY-like chemotaxis protein